MAVSIQPTPERLDELVRECLKEASGELASRSLTVTRQFGAGIPVYSMDRPLIKEALHNILSEAMRSVGESRRLRVTVKANRNAVMFAVKSPGPGLTQVQREMLFTGEPLPGSPARAREIIAAHGGVTWANGIPGRGITYYFTLPIRRRET